MRHRINKRKLNRTSAHRKALHRNMAQSLVEHGQVTTTLAKAKDIRRFFERLVALAVKSRKLASSDPAGALRFRRRIHRLLGDRSMVPAEHLADYEGMSDAARAKTMRMASGRRYRTGEPRGRLAFTGESVAYRLMERIAPRFEDRDGGYTRLIRLPDQRKGDSSSLAMVQLVGDEEPPTSLTRPKKSARRRRMDARYAAAIKAAKQRAKAGKGAATPKIAETAGEEEPSAAAPTDPEPTAEA